MAGGNGRLTLQVEEVDVRPESVDEQDPDVVKAQGGSSGGDDNGPVLPKGPQGQLNRVPQGVSLTQITRTKVRSLKEYPNHTMNWCAITPQRMRSRAIL